jgi:hypothetical protein
MRSRCYLNHRQLAEAAPIPVRGLSLAAGTTMAPHKFAVIAARMLESGQGNHVCAINPRNRQGRWDPQ